MGKEQHIGTLLHEGSQPKDKANTQNKDRTGATITAEEWSQIPDQTMPEVLPLDFSVM